MNWVEEASTGFVRGTGPWRANGASNRSRPSGGWRWVSSGAPVCTWSSRRSSASTATGRETFAFAAEPAGSPPAPAYFDHRAESTTASGSPDDPYWFDYVADAGDGFPATFVVAEQLGAEQIVLPGDRDVGPTVLPCGRLLVMGGDEVYPLPSGLARARRLPRSPDRAVRSGAPEPEASARRRRRCGLAPLRDPGEPRLVRRARRVRQALLQRPVDRGVEDTAATQLLRARGCRTAGGCGQSTPPSRDRWTIPS